MALGLVTFLLLMTIRADGPLAGLPLGVADNLATGVGLTVCGWVFAGTALAAAQLTRATRGMYGIAGAILGLAYLLRAIGDLGDGWVSWLSPIG